MKNRRHQKDFAFFTSSFIALASVIYIPHSFAEVEELSNIEMTEAYIEDGNIVVKQKRHTTPSPSTVQKPKVKVRIHLGPGEEAVSEVDQVREQDQQLSTNRSNTETEVNRDQALKQLNQAELANVNAQVPSYSVESQASLANQAFAHDAVRTSLGLSSDTQITNAHMTQYMQQFNGQISGSITGQQQSFTNSGFQISIPNLGGYQPGNHPSGDGNINVQVTDQQIIWNFLYPQE